MKKVCVVGVGAIGSHVVLLLRNCANVHMVDMDRVERKNVLSQFHAGNAVGKNKAVALQQLMRFLFNVKVDSVPHQLTRSNATEILGGSDLVLDCLDNGEAGPFSV